MSILKASDARPSLFVSMVTAIMGVFMLLAGGWAFAAPASFAAFTNYAVSEHFAHDTGAFQIGIGTTLVLCLFVRDSFLVAFGDYLSGNTIHAINHAGDMHLGGHVWDAWLLGVLSLATTGALVIRVRAIARTSTPRNG